MLTHVGGGFGSLSCIQDVLTFILEEAEFWGRMLIG